MINFIKNPGDKILELGCGNSPHPESDVRVDVRPIPGITHFTANFELPFTEEHNQAIGSDEFAAVFSHFAIEHLSYRSVPGFLKECFRVIRPGGHVIMAMPNTVEQMKWIANNTDGWDGKDLFESASEKLFGSQNMPDAEGTDHNTHKAFFSPQIAISLFTAAGFRNVNIQPYGARNTDMIVSAQKPADRILDKKPDESVIDHITYTPVNPQNCTTQEAPTMPLAATEPLKGKPFTEYKDLALERDIAKNTGGSPTYNPARMFNRDYFDGGKGGCGGYAGEGYRDFPVHNVIARHVLERKPESVLELGCARGYTLKRLQDAGIIAAGMDVSQHCYLTRVCEAIGQRNITDTPWVVPDHYTQVRRDVEYDLCFSIGFLDHLPVHSLPTVIKEMTRTCKRGLHGVNPDPLTDGDRTRLSAGRPLSWWKDLFKTYAPGWFCEVVHKSELETAPNPDWAKEWLQGDGRLKLNLGCYATMFYHGWTNIDQHDLGGWAQAQGYQYQRHDLRGGIPYHTASVDLIFMHHVLEHFDYKAGAALLRECRRVIRPTGAVRIVVPNMAKLCEGYAAEKSNICLHDFDEMNAGCAEQKTDAGKLWSLLCPDHQAGYDEETLCGMLEDAGFDATPTRFRQTAHDPVKQILKECYEHDYGGTSLFVDAVPCME